MTARSSSIRPFQLFNLAFGAAVGIGWIMVVGVWLGEAGPLGTAIAFGLVALAMLSVGVSYAQVAATNPVAGGEYAWARDIFGRSFSFWVGWFLALTYVVVVAFEIVSLGWIGRAVLGLPAATGRVDWPGLGFGALVLGIVFIANVAGAKSATRLQDVLMVLKVALSLALIVGGLAIGSTANLAPVFGLDSLRDAPTGFLTVLAMAPFFFAGFGVVAQAMAEAREPATLKALPLMMAMVIFATGLFYVGIALAVGAAAPRSVTVAAELPAAAAFAAGFGTPVAGQLVLLLGLLGLLTTLNGIFFAGLRIIRSLARDGFIPKRLDDVSGAAAWPLPAALFVAAGALLIALLGKGGLGPILNVASAATSTVMASVCASAFKQQRQDGRNGLVPGIGVAVAAVMALLPMIEALRSERWLGIPVEWLLVIVWIGLGALLRVSQSKPE
jgi:basic amino acid/polyamine antiporter, APA family